MTQWLDNFEYDPISALLERGDEAIQSFVKKDLLDNPISIHHLFHQPEPTRIKRKQQTNGCWIYPHANKKIRSQENYDQIETYRNLGVLIEQYGFSKSDPSIAKAAEYLFRFQSGEGDFRGIYGN